jgi:hypothetical protein
MMRGARVLTHLAFKVFAYTNIGGLPRKKSPAVVPG